MPKITPRDLSKLIKLYKTRNIELHKEAHFFDADTMRFFRSSICTDGFRTDGRNAVFITSEQFEDEGQAMPRKYSVRRFDYETGKIGTVHRSQGFGTLVEAVAIALETPLASPESLISSEEQE